MALGSLKLGAATQLALIVTSSTCCALQNSGAVVAVDVVDAADGTVADSVAVVVEVVAVDADVVDEVVVAVVDAVAAAVVVAVVAAGVVVAAVAAVVEVKVACSPMLSSSWQTTWPDQRNDMGQVSCLSVLAVEEVAVRQTAVGTSLVSRPAVGGHCPSVRGRHEDQAMRRRTVCLTAACCRVSHETMVEVPQSEAVETAFCQASLQIGPAPRPHVPRKRQSRLRNPRACGYCREVPSKREGPFC